MTDVDVGLTDLRSMMSEPRCLRLMRSCPMRQQTDYIIVSNGKGRAHFVHHVHVEVAVLIVAGHPLQVVPSSERITMCRTCRSTRRITPRSKRAPCCWGRWASPCCGSAPDALSRSSSTQAASALRREEHYKQCEVARKVALRIATRLRAAAAPFFMRPRALMMQTRIASTSSNLAGGTVRGPLLGRDSGARGPPRLY